MRADGNMENDDKACGLHSISERSYNDLNNSKEEASAI
jgi:hypothetical protein